MYRKDNKSIQDVYQEVLFSLAGFFLYVYACIKFVSLLVFLAGCYAVC